MPVPAPDVAGWYPDYITLAQLKHYKKLDLDDDADDDELQVAITAASRAIDDHTNRQFGRTVDAEEWTYTAYPDYVRGIWVVEIDDLMDTTDFVLSVGDNEITDYTLEPVNAAAKSRPYTRVAISSTSSVQPTGAENELAGVAFWGWLAYPAQVTQAARLQSNRFFYRKDSPHGIAGSPDNGSDTRLLAKLDPDVAMSLHGLQRPRRAA